MMIYLDDMIIFNKDGKSHFERGCQVIRRLEQNNFRINKKKLQFCLNKEVLLGEKIEEQQKSPLEEKKKGILLMKEPKNISQLRSFLGAAGWFRGFIPRFADKVKKLPDGLKTTKKWCFNDEMKEEFVKIKEEIKTMMENFNLSDYKKEFILRTDASNTGVGAVLMQKDRNGKIKPIELASRKLTPVETKYAISEK